MDGIHLNSDALRAFVCATGAQRQDVALRAEISAPALTNYLTGYRVRTSDEVRGALAGALTELLDCHVHPRALTCHCSTPEAHREDVTDA